MLLGCLFSPHSYALFACAIIKVMNVVCQRSNFNVLGLLSPFHSLLLTDQIEPIEILQAAHLHIILLSIKPSRSCLFYLKLPATLSYTLCSDAYN